MNRQKELMALKKVTIKNLECAQDVSLLKELMHESLTERLEKANPYKEQELLDIKIPKWRSSKVDWGQLLHREGLLGHVVYNSEEISPSSRGQTADNLGMRYFGGSFVDLLKKPLKRTDEIKLDGFCTNVTVTEDTILVPLTLKDILQVYTKDNELLKTIKTEKSPTSVHITHVGEFMLSCETGMFVLDADMANPPVKVSDGCYYDVCVFGKRVFSFNDNNKCIEELIRDDVEGWIKENREVPVDWLKFTSDCDTLLVRECRDNATDLEFFICVWNQHTVYQVNSQGERVRAYGSKNEQGEGGLYYPRLCGVDKEGDILVANSCHCKYTVLNTQTGLSSPVFTAENEVYDAQFVGDNTVWCSGSIGKTFVLSKHEVQF